MLSGEKAVTDAVTEAQISRQLYYQLETKALHAILRALAPGAEPTGTSGADGYTKRITELEEQVKQLQQDRRSERLLFLTRKMVKKGPLASETRGRLRKAKSLIDEAWGRRFRQPRRRRARRRQPSRLRPRAGWC
ncbi:MAG: hypothetical protein IPJ65_27300 [Archangiaceae bacterium]|nr:hypothetical protein [Archangiaceae bacterium]